MRKIEKLTYINERGESAEFSTKSVYFPDKCEGLSDIRYEPYFMHSMGQDGDSDLGGRIVARDISITGRIRERSKDKALELRRKLNHILNPHHKAVLKYEYGDFVRYISCRVEGSNLGKEELALLHHFVIQITCANPFWREESERREDIALWVGAFELPLEIPEETGIEMGYREPSLIVNVFNGGDVAAGMRVVFRSLGTVVNPSLFNVNTREFILFEGLTMQAGEVLTISTGYDEKDVTLTRNGQTSNAFRYLHEDSVYMQLAVGDNLFRYDAESNLENLEVSIYHSNNYLGV